MLLVGWRNGKGWVNFGNLNGALPTGTNSRIYTDAHGVMTVNVGNKLVRFFDPEGQVRSESFSTPELGNVDRTYLDATGNIQVMVSSGSEIKLVRIKIHRP